MRPMRIYSRGVGWRVRSRWGGAAVHTVMAAQFNAEPMMTKLWFPTSLIIKIDMFWLPGFGAFVSIASS